MPENMSIHSKAYSDINFEPINLVELLRWRADHFPDQRAYTYLRDGEEDEISMTYYELDERARAIGAWLQTLGLKGERALLIYPPGMEYVVAFFGCLYAGVIAVPAYPPDPTRLNRTLPRLQAIANDARASIALATNTILSMLKVLKFGARVTDSLEKIPVLGKYRDAIRSFISQKSAIAIVKDLEKLDWLSTENVKNELADDWELPKIDKDTIAFLQYTSGSTGSPRGVMLSHENLLYNLALIYDGFEVTPNSEGVIWLPIYHDMGLIGGVMQPLYAGIPSTLLSPIDFLQRPLRWLNIISRIKEKSVISGGPNFAYDLCVRKISAAQREMLDLSNWVLAFSGAEPVRAETIERFSQTFKSCGFRREAFYPCYGLAEATLLASGGHKFEPPKLLAIRSAELENDRIAEICNDEEDYRIAVGCGHSRGEQKIVIVNPDNCLMCESGEVGEIWITGVSVAHGYWHRPEETQQTFNAFLADTDDGPFLRTGDVGFLQDGELFITGRIKDLIIIRGRNHYPQDIELTVEQLHPNMRPGCNAAFSVDVEGEERLVLVQEIRHPKKLNADEMIKKIRQAITEIHELQTHAVVLIKPRTIAKTSSGKIQRYATRNQFLEKKLKVVAEWRASETTYDDATQSAEKTGKGVIPAHIAEPDISIDEIREAKPEIRISLLETYLQREFAQIIGLEADQIDLEQSVSNFGIDSITAIELKHEIDSNLKINYPIANLLEGASISQIALKLSKELQSEDSDAVIPITSQEKILKCPLSHGQRAMWFQHQLAPESIFNLVYAVRINSVLNIPVLKKAFQMELDRHPALRTTFIAEQGEPLQKIHEQMEVYFRHEDASSWNEYELRKRLEKEAWFQFDLEKGPLFRLHLFSKSEDEHVLLQTIHHIVADLWSQAIIVNEIETLYAAPDRQAELPPVDVRYSDYVSWQKAMLESLQGETLERYWKTKLAGRLPILNIPTDRPRPAAQTYRGDARAITLTADLTQKLKQVSEAHNATLYMTLLAVFKVLLYRYCGQEDIIVGTPANGRTQAELASTVGYFVNTLPIRSKIVGEFRFSEFLGQIRKTVIEAVTHQDYPFVMMIEKLKLKRDLSRTPLFQVMFLLQRAHLLHEHGLSSFALGVEESRMTLPGLPMESLKLKQQQEPYDLTMRMGESQGQLIASIMYNIDLFDAATINGMLAHFQNLLQAVVVDPDQSISDLSMLTSVEQEKLMREWSQPDRFDLTPVDLCLYQLFEAQVDKTPNSVAVILDNEQLTYHELNQRANLLAHQLRSKGVGPDVLVGICLERSLNMIVGLLGILKSGGAFVPLDPEYPEDRLAFMITDSSISVLLTQKTLLEKLPDHRAQVTLMASDGQIVFPKRQDNQKNLTTSANIAYVMYTSGSTGTPKGVVVSNRSFANHCLAMQKRYDLTSGDRVLQFSSLNFDASLEQIFPTLIAGATLVLRGAEIWNPSEIWKKLLDYEITVMNLPPAYWRQIAQEWPQANHSEINVQLKHIIIGGDVILRDDLCKWRRTSVNSLYLFNAYGPTETTITSTMFEITADDASISERLPIGRPQAFRYVFILDRHGNLVPSGVPGELHIGGICLSRGYINRPDLTAENFVPDGFSNMPGARLYKTGDLARFRSDGVIEFLGRVDNQVKIRGIRIELGEIETVLSQHPAVREALVGAIEAKAGEERLIAYFVADPSAEDVLNSDDLRAFSNRKLPDYMIPSAFVKIDELPRTPTGKVDRRALPAYDPNLARLKSEYAAPRSPLEETIATIWAQTMGLEIVGVHDNFFDLGGHSLMATQIISRLNKTYNIEVSLRKLFEAPTVADLAVVIAESLAGRTDEKDLNKMLEELEGLSDEEVERLLNNE